MAIFRQPFRKQVPNRYNASVWQKFHILSRAQVFVLAGLCAVVIALAVALASIPTDGTSWNRFLGFSPQFDPFVNFGSAFLTVLPLLLGYYHLARLGVLVSLAVSAVMFWANSNLCVLRIRHSTGGSFSDVARGCICGRLATAYDDGSMGTHEGIQFPRNPECTAIAAPSTSAQISQLT